MRLWPPQRMQKRQTFFFHDSTERPIQRPKDRETQKAHYSGKKKQHTLKNNLMMNADSQVVFLTPSYEGRIHDKHIADITGYSPPPGSILYQDTGFQGFTCPQVKIIQPKKQGHLVVHIYFISVDTFYEIGLDFHAISRKNVNIRKLKSKAEPKTK